MLQNEPNIESMRYCNRNLLNVFERFSSTRTYYRVWIKHSIHCRQTTRAGWYFHGMIHVYHGMYVDHENTITMLLNITIQPNTF